MQPAREAFDALAALLAYPGAGGGAARPHAELVELVAQACPQAGERLQPFLDFVRRQGADELEEFFTATFEVNPRCCLEVGWQVYGESYNRGVFLVRMRELLRDLEIPEGTELPDHLTHVLPALGRLEAEDAAALAAGHVIPAVERMAVGMASDENPYEAVLDAALVLLRQTAGAAEEAQPA